MNEKGFTRRLWDFLGSRDLSVYIFIMGLTYTLFLVVFGMIVPVPWVNNISKLLPFKVLYLVFFINLTICEIKWIPVIIRRCRKPKVPETSYDLRRFGHKIKVQNPKFKIQGLEQYLRRRGYKIWNSDNNDNSTLNTKQSTLLYASRGRFSPVGNLLFHLAFLPLLLGVAASTFFRFEGSARLTEGYPFTGTIREYSSVSISPLGALPEVSFFLNKITPSFWKGDLLFTDLRADVKDRLGPGSIWMSSPYRMGGASITINGIGLTPMYILRDRAGMELDAGYVNLAVFTPGNEDHFEIPGYPYQIFVSFYPDHEMVEGKVVNRSMNTKNPLYAVRIFRGRVPLYSGMLKPEDDAVFENLRLSFPDFRYWGEFRIVRDPGFAFIWVAFFLFGVGLIWRLLLYRREIIVVRSDEGVILYVDSDYFQALFLEKLKRFSKIAPEVL